MSVWWIINILFLLIGAALAGWAYCRQSTEDYDALLYFVVGVFLFIVGFISSGIKLVWFT